MRNRAIIFTTSLSAVICFWLLPRIQALIPPPDGCYPNFTTAEGCNALRALTTGTGNTGLGWYSLYTDTTGSLNTAIGAATLALNNADSNTAIGAGALVLNTTGEQNVAIGRNALINNNDGGYNNAVGTFALFNNASGLFNNAHGRNALMNNTGSENNAFGDLAMEGNTTGNSNTAIGDDALRFCVDGSSNIAIGDEAGTGLGASVNNCIAIGAPGAGPFATFDNTCFIGNIYGEPVSDPATQVPVYVDQFNVVGIFNSSRRYKHDIAPMDKASEKLYNLKPVTFKFNSDWKNTTQYGLIAEEVAEVDRQLVAAGNDGEITTVHYEKINAMLLNEFLKEHKRNEAQERTIAELMSTIARQERRMEALTTQIQKVSAQLEIRQPVTNVVVNEP